MAAKQLMPEARLEQRDSDVALTEDQFLKIGLFSQLKRKPSLDRYPGAMVLRRYRKGEVVFRQGEAGWTAFYILTTEDLLHVWEARLEAAWKENEQHRLQLEINLLRERLEQLKEVPQEDELRTAAKVYIAVARNSPSTAKGLANRLIGFSNQTFTGPVRNEKLQTLYIPVGGQLNFSMDSFSAPMQEGELFGEMSCMYRTPRSATVVARRDCYMLEILRNVLDQIQRDPVYKARMDEVYKARVLGMQLRKLTIFSELTQEEFDSIRNKVELVSYEPGDLICDEHDRSDAIYIVRTGLVKVMKNVSHLLQPSDITDWTELGKAFLIGANHPTTPLGKFFAMLPADVQEIIRTNPDLTKAQGAERRRIVLAMNDLLKSTELVNIPEFTHLTGSPAFKEQVKRLPEDVKKWTQLDHRYHNRIFMEMLYPKAVRRHQRLPGPETILSYCSPGDFFGEIGVMLDQPRSATCQAYGHPNDHGVVELVKIPRDVFRRLVESSPTIAAKVNEEITRRRAHTITRLATPIFDESNQVLYSDRFEELGLIQGQMLMLIDLDRCTRCDECVKACVNTHDDGHSRLFLDGPRFDKYLVPTACRSCLDPVCLIGCPVGSIHRGDNREINIEDWCIGCGLCADSCPYGSIQMHDLGILPENSRGWRYLPASMVQSTKWFEPAFHDSKWLPGKAPFPCNRDFRDLMKKFLSVGDPTTASLVNFRHEFQLGKEQLGPEAEFRLEVLALGSVVRVWLNGQELTADDKPKRGRREYSIPPRPPAPKKPEKGAELAAAAPVAAPPPLTVHHFLRPGRNVVAAQVSSNIKPGEVVFQLRVDEIHKPNLPENLDAKVADEITEKLVTQRAVVCDLCSTLPAQKPACVQACPHDAAMRVNSRFEFPLR